MANYVICNVAFEWSGKQYRPGDVFEDDADVYLQFPTRFDRQNVYVTGGEGTVLAAGTVGGTIVGSVPVTNSGGTVLGYMALYDEITDSE